MHPSWSPDGTRLVFSTGRFGAREIVTIRPDGTDLKRFDPAVTGWSPSWAPDGRIVFAYTFGGISIVNADGTGLVRLTRTVNDSLPVLRP
jgi:Tol biopolymer transport system component